MIGYCTLIAFYSHCGTDDFQTLFSANILRFIIGSTQIFRESLGLG